MVEELGVKAVGISGKDGGLLKVTEEIIQVEKISDYVGEIKKVNPKILHDLLEKRFSSDHLPGRI